MHPELATELDEAERRSEQDKAGKFGERNDFVRRREDLLDLSLREQILNNEQFVACVMMFLEWLNEENSQDLRVVVEAKPGRQQSRVFYATELAGMTASSLLGDFLRSQGVDPHYVNNKNKIKNHKDVETWLAERIRGVMEDLSASHALMLVRALLKYIELHKGTPEIFSRIRPIARKQSASVE